MVSPHHWLPAVFALLALAGNQARSGEDPGGQKVRDYTDGYMPVCGEVRHVQTFKATSGKIEEVSFRAARAMYPPCGPLKIEVREPGKPPLASGQVKSGYDTLTRWYSVYCVKLRAEGLKKGQTYELAFSAPEDHEDQPWLINCFYRDAYPDGEYRRERNGRPIPAKAGKFDLVFTILGDGPDCSSIPGGMFLESEHFGIGHDGTDLFTNPGTTRPERQLRTWPAAGAAPAAGPADAKQPDPPPVKPAVPPRHSPEAATVRSTREQSLAEAGKDGKVLWSLADPVAPNLLWIAVDGKFLHLYDAGVDARTTFGEYLKLTGRAELTARGLAFGKDSVWAATDRGALVYDRRTRAWCQCVINLDMDLLDAQVESVRLTARGVAFKLAGDRGEYEFDTSTRKWTKLVLTAARDPNSRS